MMKIKIKKLSNIILSVVGLIEGVIMSTISLIFLNDYFSLEGLKEIYEYKDMFISLNQIVFSYIFVMSLLAYFIFVLFDIAKKIDDY